MQNNSAGIIFPPQCSQYASSFAFTLFVIPSGVSSRVRGSGKQGGGRPRHQPETDIGGGHPIKKLVSNDDYGGIQIKKVARTSTTSRYASGHARVVVMF